MSTNIREYAINAPLIAANGLLCSHASENPSLQMKLQSEFLKPAYDILRNDANLADRIGRLMSPDGLATLSFREAIH